MSNFFMAFPGSNEQGERFNNQKWNSSENNNSFSPNWNEQSFFESPNNQNWNDSPPPPIPTPNSYFNTKSNKNDKFYGFRNQSENPNNNRYPNNKSDKDIFDV